jgi:hypothetical protein
MCEDCGGRICALFDDLISDYWQTFPRRAPKAFAEIEPKRSRYVPMDVRNTPRSAMKPLGLLQLVEHAGDLGITREEFLEDLVNRSQYSGPIQDWLQGKIPNGLIRKILLGNIEDILREHGARPVYSLKMAA